MRWPDRLSLMAPALLPLIWFEVVRNHTQIHAFPARSLPIGVGMLAAAIVVRLAPLDDCTSLGAPSPGPPASEAPTTAVPSAGRRAEASTTDGTLT